SCSLVLRPGPPISTLFPYTTLFRSIRRKPERAFGHDVRFELDSVGLDEARAAAVQRVVRLPVREIHEALAVLLVADHPVAQALRSEEHTSELQSRENLVCRLLLEKK